MANKSVKAPSKLQVCLTPQEFERLDTMCSASNQTRSDFVRMMLDNAWDKFNGDPKLKEVLQIMKEFEEKIKNATGGSN